MLPGHYSSSTNDLNHAIKKSFESRIVVQIEQIVHVEEPEKTVNSVCSGSSTESVEA